MVDRLRIAQLAERAKAAGLAPDTSVFTLADQLNNFAEGTSPMPLPTLANGPIITGLTDGKAVVGQEVTTDVEWNDDTSRANRWMLDGVSLSETNTNNAPARYTPTAADVGKSLLPEAKGENASGATTMTAQQAGAPIAVVAEAPSGPAPVDPSLWDVEELTDPAEAPNGQPGFLRATFRQMPTEQGYTLTHALLGAAPNQNQPAVQSNSTFTTTTGQPIGATVTSKLYWRPNSAGETLLAGEKTTVIQGLDSGTIDPPTVTGQLADVVYARGSGPQVKETAQAFAGDELVFSLVSPPSAVSIDPATGRVTTTTAANFTATIVVRATNSAGSAETDFDARVMVAPSVVAPVADQTWQQGTGNKTVQCAPAFAGDELAFSITAGPGSIVPATGVATFSTANPVNANTTVRAANPVGNASDTFAVVVQAQGGGNVVPANSIAEVISLMSSVQPGTIIELAPGTYTQPLVKSNVTKAAPGVIVRGRGAGQEPRLTTNGGGPRLDLNNVRGFTIDGIIFETTEKDGAGFPWGSVTDISDCGSIKLRNCTFRGGQYQLRPKGNVDGMVVEFCEFDNCQQGMFESFAGGGPITLRNNYFHNDNANPAVMREDGRHPDGTQFGSQNWHDILIENNRYDFRKDGFNCHFFGGADFGNVTIRGNWYTSGDQNTVRLSRMNVMFERNRMQDAPGRNAARLRIEGSDGIVTGTVRDSVLPRAIVSTSSDRTTKSNIVISATALPPGWATSDVGNGRFGPFQQGA